jgi:hypothetical protein
MQTLTPLPQSQVDLFRSQIQGPAEAICPQYGLDPLQCVAEAIEVSGCGRFTMSYNWWNLPGRGSRGCLWAVVAPLTWETANGGVAPMAQQRAKFGSAAEAVEAWCKARRG